jgi:very-short-patch-repair endonuclease
VDAVDALERLGGRADARALLRLTTRRRLTRAVAAGGVDQVRRGCYALPTAAVAQRRAAEIGGVVCLRSAAAVHGWALKAEPKFPEIAVRRNRRVTPEMREETAIHYLDLAVDDLHHGVTSPLRTLVDCARQLPFDEALAIADSALRTGAVTASELRDTVVHGAGSTRVRRVFDHADGRAANPFESVLRAQCIDAGLEVTPQVVLRRRPEVIRPDLVDRCRRLVVEAESLAHHASRADLRRDANRYTWLAVDGWWVLRFTWEQVMFDPGYVRAALEAIRRRVERAEVDLTSRRPA